MWCYLLGFEDLAWEWKGNQFLEKHNQQKWIVKYESNTQGKMSSLELEI